MKRTFRGSVAALVIAAMALAACGDDEETDSTSAPTAAPATDASSSGDPTTTPETGGGADASECVSQAAEIADAAKAPVALKAPPSTIDVSSLAGSSVWLILVTNNELGQQIGSGFEEAAATVGFEATIFDGEGTASKFNEGVSQAVAQGADAIILWGIDPGVVSEPLGEAIDNGTVIVDIFNGSPDQPLPNGVFAHVTPDFKASGRNMAAWMLADSGCDLRTAIFGASVLELHNDMTNAAAATVAELCPECKAIVEDVDLATIATDFGPNVASVLTREGDINYLFPVFDGGMPLILPAIPDFEGKIIGHDGVPSSLEDIRNGGGGQVATGAFPPGGWIGYALIDQVARGLLEEAPADWTIPIRLIDPSNVGANDAELFPEYQDFQAEFATAWGVG